MEVPRNCALVEGSAPAKRHHSVTIRERLCDAARLQDQLCEQLSRCLIRLRYDHAVPLHLFERIKELTFDGDL